MTYSKIVEILLTAVILYFGFPLFAAATVFCALYYCGGGVGYGQKVFDFFADIMYPWRWKKREKKSTVKESTMKTVTIYTDGACSGNPGPGGWGAILMYGGHKKELSGGEAQTTNNRMELTGVIAALEALKEPCAVELYSDSKYVIDGLGKGWAKGWRARGWVKSDKKPALNPDLWGRLLDLCEKHTVRLHWVKGHAENQFNNRCDQLAVAESQKYK